MHNMVFTKGNTFGGKKKSLNSMFTGSISPSGHVSENPAHQSPSGYKEFKCGSCGKKLTGPLAHLIDKCYDCVEKSQPGGKFAEYPKPKSNAK